MTTTTKATSALGVGLLVTIDSTTYAFHEVKSVPAIGMNPDKLDSTSLEHEMHVYVKDIPDSDDLEFTMNAIPYGDDTSNYNLLEKLDEDEAYTWTVIYPQQKRQVSFTAQWSWSMSGSEVSSIQEMTLTLIRQSSFDWTTYDSTQTITYKTTDTTS